MDSQTPAHVITLRPVGPADEEFLFQLYASTRADELAPLGWSPAQQAVFLRLQFDAQRRDYQARFPAAGHQLILVAARPAGRIWVARTEAEIRLVDLALLPAAQGGGVGTQLLRSLIDEATQTQRPLRLSVLKNNRRAMHLYERLGFAVVGDTDTYFQMEHQPVK
ncbi:MAG: GNAT family N-acetyltransferase [Pyrinomonadaceae bacterium]